MPSTATDALGARALAPARTYTRCGHTHAFRGVCRSGTREYVPVGPGADAVHPSIGPKVLLRRSIGPRWSFGVGVSNTLGPITGGVEG